MQEFWKCNCVLRVILQRLYVAFNFVSIDQAVYYHCLTTDYQFIGIWDCKSFSLSHQHISAPLLCRERSFEVDEKELEKQYKRLQKFLHPDLSSLKSQVCFSLCLTVACFDTQNLFIFTRAFSRLEYNLVTHSFRVWLDKPVRHIGN